MVNAQREFSNEPPLNPLVNCWAVADDFQWRYLDRKRTDQVIDYCRRAPTLDVAIDRAVRARDINGKHHNHQSKVDLGARLELGRRLRTKEGEIRKIKKGHDKSTWNTRFDMLHDLIEEARPNGIGPVTTYDVAVRVGAWLRLQPSSVYMHAGVRQGCKALEGALERKKVKNKLFGAHRLPRVPMNLFPKPFNKMRADDVEDILCTYREVFESW